MTCGYDVVLIDIDDNSCFTRFDMMKASKNYFVTGFDSYSLKKGLEMMLKSGELCGKIYSNGVKLTSRSAA